MKIKQALGPVMFNIEGADVTLDDKRRLLHPLAGGLILFTRNFTSREQIVALIKHVKSLRSPALLVCIDHEGGRVQRFRDGFTEIPEAAAYVENKDGERLAKNAAWLMATELREIGIDFSFAPVLDVNTAGSSVIGRRAFHEKPEQVVRMAKAYCDGMHEAGMATTGKHFPGHGAVAADSHHELPLDNRTLAQLWQTELLPYQKLSGSYLDAVMTAHIRYPKVDRQPPAFSSKWIKNILREQVEFKGLVFSDDITMHGAHTAGSPVERCQAALIAGCDVVLVCNDVAATDEVLGGLEFDEFDSLAGKLETMRGREASSNPGRIEVVKDEISAMSCHGAT
ncbi:MAG: beta-N-acetylhexosaminidase [Arenicellales bacterium WSBS_2016_MAG_OTU3]